MAVSHRAERLPCCDRMLCQLHRHYFGDFEAWPAARMMRVEFPLLRNLRWPGDCDAPAAQEVWIAEISSCGNAFASFSDLAVSAGRNTIERLRADQIL